MSIKDSENSGLSIHQAIGRCIITGVAVSVLTYLIWKSVMVFSPEVPLSFHLTCLMVLGVSILATGVAIYRLKNPPLVVKKSYSSSNASFRRDKHVGGSTVLMPIAYSSSDMAWFQKN